MNVTVEKAKPVAIIFKALSHEVRLGILCFLLDGTKTYTQMLFEFQINSKELSRHLSVLRQTSMIARVGEKKGFKLTEYGLGLTRLIQDLIKIANVKGGKND